MTALPLSFATVVTAFAQMLPLQASSDIQVNLRHHSLSGFTIQSYVLADAQAAAAERIRFAPNSTGATVEGEVQGSRFQDYLLRARAGQKITASITGTSSFLQVQVFTPRGRHLYVGSSNWSGRLPRNGLYRLRVSIAPAQQTNESESYSLTVAVE